MKKGVKKPATLGDIARTAGVSRAAVSYALRNQPEVGVETKQRILKIAKRLGYAPDPRISSWMGTVRAAKARQVTPIAWLNTGWSRDIWDECPYLRPYMEGARQRCAEMGYRLDEFWIREPGMRMERISQILYNRGIQGVIIAPPDKRGHIHLRLKWERFATVSFERALVAPGLIQVAQDRYYNTMLCLKMVRRLGFRRIAILIEQQSDRRARYGIQAAAACFFLRAPTLERLPFLYSGPTGKPEGFASWLRKYRPDVIVGHNILLVGAVEAAGFKVPGQISVVHTAVDGDCEEWAGIWGRKREIGAATVETVVSLLQSNQLGLPAVPRDVLIRGQWQAGSTLQRPIGAKG